MPEPTPTYTNRLQCVECGRVSRELERGWTAHLTIDDPNSGRNRGIHADPRDERVGWRKRSVERAKPHRSRRSA